jgi:hypothetical protein
MNTCKALTFDLSKVKVEYGLWTAKSCQSVVEQMPCEACIERELAVRRASGAAQSCAIVRSSYAYNAYTSSCAYRERIDRERAEKFGLPA